MRKIFYASTVEAAVTSARRELGEDALLVDVQQMAGDPGAPGGYQVLFELDNGNPSPETFIKRSESSAAPALSELKSELAGLSSLVAHLASSRNASFGPPELTRVAAALQSYDLPQDWTHQLLNRAARRLGSEARESVVDRIVGEELRALVAFSPVHEPEHRKTVLALVGPPGAGKTTMLVKLAMKLGVSARRSTLVLTSDSYRVAAADQLRTYSALLGLPFQLVESPRALSSALAEHRQKELILIDTPGFSPRDWDSAREWSSMIDANPEVQINLVLPATMRASDLRDLVRRWAIFKPSQLIFTRMDETAAYGGCVSAALDAGLPISWFGTGQDIPEDIEPASANLLYGEVLTRNTRSMTAVA